MKDRDRPFYQIIDGHRLPGPFSEDVYRSGLLYKPEEGDIVLDTFPKCGTHWVVEILKASYQVCKGITPGSVFLEKFGLNGILTTDRPRIIFTHLPQNMVPFSPCAKYIYVARNPKDCCVSFYHHTKNIPAYGFQDGTFDEYFEIFVDGLTDFGNYYHSVRSWYAKKDEPYVLIVTYESLHADIRGSVLKIAGFVDQTLASELATDERKMQAVLEKINVDNMKKEWPIQFVRKGVVGEWKNYFSEEQSRRNQVAPTMGVERHPLFQLIDGIKLPLGFDPVQLRSCLKYQASAGDVFIDTFPKCGTNWTKRIVQLLFGENSARDSDYGLSTSFFEMVGKDVIEGLPQPRIITTHLEYQLLPKHPGAKYIYVVRNPKDCCVSYFHHTKKTKVYHFEDGTFDEYLQLFVDGETSFGDYFSHLLSWYPNIHVANVIFLTYEDMKKDPEAAVLKIAKFLEVKDPELMDPMTDKFKKVMELSSVDSMKEYLVNNYKKAMGDQDPEKWTAKEDYPLARAPPPPDVMVRKGIIGDWRNVFSKEQSRKMEQAMADKCGKLIDLSKIWDPKDWMEDV